MYKYYKVTYKDGFNFILRTKKTIRSAKQVENLLPMPFHVKKVRPLGALTGWVMYKNYCKTGEFIEKSLDK